MVFFGGLCLFFLFLLLFGVFFGVGGGERGGFLLCVVIIGTLSKGETIRVL